MNGWMNENDVPFPISELPVVFERLLLLKQATNKAYICTTEVNE